MENADLKDRLQKRRGSSFMNKVPEVSQIKYPPKKKVEPVKKEEPKMLSQVEQVTAPAVATQEVKEANPPATKPVNTLTKGVHVGVDLEGKIALKTFGTLTTLEFIALAEYLHVKSQTMLKDSIDSEIDNKLNSILKGVSATATGVVTLLNKHNDT